MPGRSSPSPSRISAMSAPTPRTSRRPRPPRAAWWCAQDVTEPSNWRATRHLRRLAASHGVPGLAGIDTRRADRAHPRRRRAERRALPSPPMAASTSRRWRAQAARLAGAGGDGPGEGGHLPAEPTRWDETRPGPGPRAIGAAGRRRSSRSSRSTTAPSATSCAASPRPAARVTVVPATATAEEILRHQPDGVFLSNGPGDPAATGDYAVPAIQGVLDDGRAGVRHLPRPPAAGAGAGREDLQARRAAIAAPTSR